MIPVGDTRHDDAVEIGQDRFECLALLGCRLRQLGGDVARPNRWKHGMPLGVAEVLLDPRADPCKVFCEGLVLNHNSEGWRLANKNPP